MLLYLHGFRSSPSSAKAQLLHKTIQAQALDIHFVAPQLPESPLLAIETCLKLIAENKAEDESLIVMGSSLGGYYATWLAEKLACPAVLINPCIYAARDLSTQIGQTQYYHTGEPFCFTSQYVKELAHLFVPKVHAERYLLLAGTNDELLDWQEMVARYQGAKQVIAQGQTHAFTDLQAYLPTIFDFILAH
ncbi:YqiA/YcfP family alpha/beta fold hydrolase [Brackiella oedipodis]|uniref:YqiA/YcfP family alpha/beta fold hydrolase n=1 Tax=Brackiella oedipodis TaxID=124225 RepID=UPI00048D602B|nr:YqiA/YcfP family alpha/beta fold hydrolase [Brackiella oedipodis]